MPSPTMPMKMFFMLMLVGGCATRSIDIGEALVNGRQSEVDDFSRRVLRGESLVTDEMLRDDREVSRDVIVHFERDGGTAQYGVDLVSDYFMCLLEARQRTSTRQVIAISASDARCKTEDACEVCNSLTYPLPTELREALRRYWREHMGL